MQLETWEWILVFWATPVCIAQCAFALWVLYLRWEPSRLDQLSPAPPAEWPRLSVIIPARNEQETLEAALETLLAQTYPNLEIILIDDRSTDDTGAIIDRMAAFDARIRPLHIDSLPDGWLGKVHALDRGAQHATGDWLLFTDADVHFESSTLERAIAYCLEDQREFLTIMPTFERHGVFYDAAMTAFGLVFAVATQPHSLGQEGTKSFLGIGAFNLVSRKAYARSEGFEFLKMELADDIGFGYIMHRAGVRAAFLAGGDFVRIDWYSGVGAMVRGLEKNSFSATARFSLLRCAAIVLIMLSLVFAPLAAAFQPTLPWLTLLGAVALSACAYLNVRTGRLMRISIVPALIAPLGAFIAVYALIRSAAICSRDGGIRWRETWYPLEALKSGQRVKL